jgi:hypothetical protein
VNSVTTMNDGRVVSDGGSGIQLARASNILSYMILAGGLATIGVAAYLVVVSYSSLPYWDGWIQIKYAVERPQPSVFEWLWAQHNEHRLLIPKLFLLGDLRWFGARQRSLLVSIFGIQLLHLALLSWSMRVLGVWRGAVWRTGTGLVAFCLFCSSQWENFVWGFQTCFVLPGLFATLSLIALLLYWTRGRGKYLVLCIAAALGATYSLANGNLLWPLLMVTAILLRLRRVAILSLLVAGTVSTSLFLYGYVRPSYAISSARTPIAVLKYLAAYFGSSWIPRGIRPAEVIGIAGLLVMLCLLFRLRSCIRSGRAFCVQLMVTLLFCAGTGAITAMGRSGFGVTQAFTSRYQTVALLFWCCLGLMLLSLAASLAKWRAIVLILAQLALLAIMLVAAKLSTTPLTRAKMYGFRLNAAGMALATNVPDLAQLQWTSPEPEQLPALALAMREERLSVFSERPVTFLGKPLDSILRLEPTQDCTGHVEPATVIDAAGQRSLKITGWAWNDAHHRAPKAILAVTDGIVTGIGAVGDWREIDAAHPAITSKFAGFTGYVTGAPKASLVEVYAVEAAESACHFATLPAE